MRPIPICVIGTVAVGLSFLSYVEPGWTQTTERAVEAALIRTFGLNPDNQRAVAVSEESDGLTVRFHRDAFSASTRLPFLVRYLPESVAIKISRRGGYQFHTIDPIGPFTTDSYVGNETGRTKVADLDIRGVVPLGLLDQAVLNATLKDVEYRSSDGTHETIASQIGLNAYKNQRFFGPSTLQLMYSLKDARDIVSEQGQIRHEISTGSMLYTLLAVGMDLNPVLRKLWEGAPLGEVMSVASGTTLADSLSKVRAVETNYSAADIAYKGDPIDFGLGKVSMKYQSRTCGGCEGRFDIGADHLSVRSVPLGAVLNELVPEHVWVSGQIKGIDYIGSTFSRDAMLNPFADEVQFFPDLRKIGSFDMPAFKFAGFDAWTEFSGEGSLTVRHDDRLRVSGQITLKIKKGRERVETMLSRSSNDLLTEDLRYRLRKAFSSGKQEGDGTMSFNIDIADNNVRVGSTKVW